MCGDGRAARYTLRCTFLLASAATESQSALSVTQSDTSSLGASNCFPLIPIVHDVACYKSPHPELTYVSPSRTGGRADRSTAAHVD